MIIQKREDVCSRKPPSYTKKLNNTYKFGTKLAKCSPMQTRQKMYRNYLKMSVDTSSCTSSSRTRGSQDSLIFFEPRTFLVLRGPPFLPPQTAVSIRQRARTDLVDPRPVEAAGEPRFGSSPLRRPRFCRSSLAMDTKMTSIAKTVRTPYCSRSNRKVLHKQAPHGCQKPCGPAVFNVCHDKHPDGAESSHVTP